MKLNKIQTVAQTIELCMQTVCIGYTTDLCYLGYFSAAIFIVEYIKE